MIRFLFAIPLIGHGLAHFSGFLASWTGANVGFADNPWIFSDKIFMNSGVGHVFGIIWMLAMAGLVSAGLGIIFRWNWWAYSALAGAILSLMVIVPWWFTVPPGARIGAVFDLAIIIAYFVVNGKFDMQSL